MALLLVLLLLLLRTSSSLQHHQRPDDDDTNADSLLAQPINNDDDADFDVDDEESGFSSPPEFKSEQHHFRKQQPSSPPPSSATSTVTHRHHHHHHQLGKSSGGGGGGKAATQWDKVMHDVKRANQHYLKIRAHARCKEPRPRVVKVKDLHHDTTKEYLPRCTILHRCSDDVGCCDHDTMQCLPKTTEAVELYFYVLRLSADGGAVAVHGGNTVEKLQFVNHTECECQIINDRPRSAAGGAHKHRCPECPAEYNIREHPNGLCSCDCFDRQKACMRLKRGRETLADADRRCVESGRCNPPVCEYGQYDVTLGRCPRKHERRSAAASAALAANQHHHNRHWWQMEERD